MHGAEITEKEITVAQKKAAEMGQIKNSIYAGGGNVYGFLGEIITAKYINATIENTYDYDLIKNDLKIDVKTKACQFKPNPDFECSVYRASSKQKCDYYIFVRILKDLSYGWILGAIDKDDFFKKAVLHKKGSLDPKSNLGWKFKADCYNLPISSLLNIVTT